MLSEVSQEKLRSTRSHSRGGHQTETHRRGQQRDGHQREGWGRGVKGPNLVPERVRLWVGRPVQLTGRASWKRALETRVTLLTNATPIIQSQKGKNTEKN